MNNTHKLLLAFIEASGYEVEEVDAGHTNFIGSFLGVDTYGKATDYKVTKKPAEDRYEQRKRNYLATQGQSIYDRMRNGPK